MKKQTETLETVTYETPQVEVIEIAVEKGYAGSNLENPNESDESGW